MVEYRLPKTGRQVEVRDKALVGVLATWNRDNSEHIDLKMNELQNLSLHAWKSTLNACTLNCFFSYSVFYVW